MPRLLLKDLQTIIFKDFSNSSDEQKCKILVPIHPFSSNYKGIKLFPKHSVNKITLCELLFAIFQFYQILFREGRADKNHFKNIWWGGLVLKENKPNVYYLLVRDGVPVRAKI